MFSETNEWKSKIKADSTEWLLEKNNPSIRYFTLCNIFEQKISNPEIQKLKDEIMVTGIVPIILDKQSNEGCWCIPENFYVKSKYKGTVWQIIILAELGANGNDKRIKKAYEFILKYSQDRKSGGFCYRGNKNLGGNSDCILPCLTANMVWSLIRFGYLEDPRVQHGIDWLIKYQRFDDGIENAPKGWFYDKFEVCWGKHTCHMGVVKTLKALAEIPINKRSDEVKKTIEKGAEFILKHHIHKRSHNLNQISKPEWLQFGFPLLWNTDVLEILGILSKLAYKDKRMQEAMNLLISKQNDEGKWISETKFHGRFIVNLEKKNKASKWVTLNALKVLKDYYV